MNQIKFITLALILTFTFGLPFRTWAIDTLPPIPVSDSALRDKEAGITVFGFTVPGTGWDALANVIVKKLIESMVNSTVSWINNGFEGNPAYVTNPKQYFTDIADGIAGDFIAGSDLNVLCSPFQTQVRLALQKSYVQLNPFQCTLTEVVGNIDAFYNDFSEGGWDGWFSMTQNNANNPYGTYLDTKLELDSRIASAIGIKNQQLDWGKGFLSFERCAGTEVLDTASGKKTCIGAKEIVTPGTVIEGQLQNVLGTGVRQMELADEFDELVGALVGQLLQKTVFSIKGLFSGHDPAPTGGGGALDIDGDGTADGWDYDGDGLLDLCYFGGVSTTSGPPCKGSASSGGGDGGSGLTCADVPTAQSCSAPNQEALVQRVKDYLIAQNINISGMCGAFEITRRVAWAAGAGLLTTNHSGNCNGYAAGNIAYPDDSEVDILQDEGGANNPIWNPGLDNPEPAVHYEPAPNPGDPPGSY